MGYKGRFITTFISLLVGIPYCTYNFLTLTSIERLMIDLSVLLIVTIIIYWLGKQYDKANFNHKELMIKQKQLVESYKELQESQTDFKLLFDKIDAMIWLNDLTKEKVLVSKGIEKLFGYLAVEFEKNYYFWLETTHPDDRAGVERYYERLLEGKTDIHEWRIIRPDGQLKWIQSRGKVILNRNGKPIKLLGVTLDITRQKKLEDKLKQMAYYDELTMLPNRSLLYEFLKKSISGTKLGDDVVVVLFIDLDGFKAVNDNYGHYIGDLLLKEVGHRLKLCIGEKDMVSRLGGDEFIVVLNRCSKESATEIACEINTMLSKPFILKEKVVHVTASIGASISPADGDDEELLIQRADKAMYAAKYHGKNTLVFFEHGEIR